MSPIQSKTVRTNKISQPGSLRADYALSEKAEKRVARDRKEIINIIHGKDKRRLMIVGPCSLDETEAVHEFVDKIMPVAEEVKDQLKVVIRANPAKPRTTVGWRGLEQDSVEKARDQLVRVAEKMPLAMELLEPYHLAWYGDLLSLGWIGARSIEVQNVRLMASSAPKLPTLLKNRSDGALKPAVQARMTVGAPHHQVPLIDNEGVLALHDTPGNPNSAIILRGSEDNKTNITVEAIDEVTRLNTLVGLPDTGVVIDISHSNGAAESAGKSAAGQKAAFQRTLDVLKKRGDQIRGVMLEGYINEGNGLGYGLSRTDPCVDVDTTIDMIRELAKKTKGK